ncbi:MAG: sulfite exporter TauE/SafE family protein [Ascidiaceihabitans sp.]|uniref:sulfite exporter TauE/SafE family protein n=2 Tax=Ascidiaceihabitans sp. TaxID=1872644 RepID=UPI003299A7D8
MAVDNTQISMLDAFQTALQTEGLFWLVLSILAAGVVRGFSGFGSAMIIMPVASSVLSPFSALVFLMTVECFGPLPNLRNALQTGHLGETARLVLGAIVALPLGLFALSVVSPDAFGWAVSGIVLVLLCILLTGWRYTGPMGPRMIFGTGLLGGFSTGFVGLPGPPVIMLYMASSKPIAVIRANFLLYLFGMDLVMLPAFWALGWLDLKAVVIGVVLIGPYIIANMVGARLFNPQAEGQFRTVAYIVIAASAILGLPLWKG